jgi:hypothetical protein
LQVQVADEPLQQLFERMIAGRLLRARVDGRARGDTWKRELRSGAGALRSSIVRCQCVLLIEAAHAASFMQPEAACAPAI